MSHPILTTPTPNAQKLEALRQIFPQVIETDEGQAGESLAQIIHQIGL